MKYAEKLFESGKSDINSTVNYIVDKITFICDKIGPRAPGSPEELKAQEALAEDLKKWTDDVSIEEFKVHRQAFMGFIPFTVALAIISVILFWLNMPLKAFCLTVIATIPLVLEFLMYKQFIDPLFPGHPSHNVLAIRKPTGEAKKVIYLVGHSDSQYEWTLNYKLGGNGMKCFLIPAVVGLIVSMIANFVMWIFSRVTVTAQPIDTLFFKIVGIAMLLFLPCFIGFLFFQNPFKSVPGANDNLSGCLCVMSVAKTLEEAGVRFENTELRILLTGSEEAGLRGAKAFVKKHGDELRSKETIVIAVDTMRDLKDIAVYDRDLSGTLKHDAQVKALVKRAGANCGRELPFASVYIGGTDAAAFTQGKIKATGFAAMDPTPPRYYHTRLDEPSLLIPEALKIGTEILAETVCLYDSEGL